MGFWNDKTCKTRVCTSAQRRNTRKRLNIKICENNVHRYRDFTDGNMTEGVVVGNLRGAPVELLI